MKKIILILCLIPMLVFADTGQEQVTTIAATTAGTVPSGARCLIFSAPSGVTGTIATAPFVALERRTLPAQAGDTLGPVPYTVSGGTLYITILQRR
jgi:hypothetical protein